MHIHKTNFVPKAIDTEGRQVEHIPLGCINYDQAGLSMINSNWAMTGDLVEYPIYYPGS